MVFFDGLVLLCGEYVLLEVFGFISFGFGRCIGMFFVLMGELK